MKLTTSRAVVRGDLPCSRALYALSAVSPSTASSRKSSSKPELNTGCMLGLLDSDRVCTTKHQHPGGRAARLNQQKPMVPAAPVDMSLKAIQPGICAVCYALPMTFRRNR
eukprot:TRINITY_DN106_c0_g1_i4.p2 TRINITY_DN106_c0_g1~~TRINITY_DN106_c0_g1_i4.p2  ORF type:complete len:110 (+),score=7.28 TRINITY_DN106_c0_g1_i4:1082-1411(+)